MNIGRVLDRLLRAERVESNVWFAQDYRQAYICAMLASDGEKEPFVQSSYRIFGTHPNNVWRKILANRRAKLGREFGLWYDNDGNMLPDINVPRKPASTTAEQFCNARLAAVLMFPKIMEVEHADVEQERSVRGSTKKEETVYTMPEPSRSTEHQPLRILPAEEPEFNAG